MKLKTEPPNLDDLLRLVEQYKYIKGTLDETKTLLTAAQKLLKQREEEFELANTRSEDTLVKLTNLIKELK